MADLGKFPGTEMEVFSKYPDSYRLDHPNLGDVRKTPWTKGVITEFKQLTDDPLTVESLVKVQIDGLGESDYIPIFSHPKEFYWDDDDALARDFDETNGYFKQAWKSFRGGDEVAVMLKEGVPVAVVGFADGVPRLGESMVKLNFPKDTYYEYLNLLKNPSGERAKIYYDNAESGYNADENGPDGRPLNLLKECESTFIQGSATVTSLWHYVAGNSEAGSYYVDDHTGPFNFHQMWAAYTKRVTTSRTDKLELKISIGPIEFKLYLDVIYYKLAWDAVAYLYKHESLSDETWPQVPFTPPSQSYWCSNPGDVLSSNGTSSGGYHSEYAENPDYRKSPPGWDLDGNIPTPSISSNYETYYIKPTKITAKQCGTDQDEVEQTTIFGNIYYNLMGYHIDPNASGLAFVRPHTKEELQAAGFWPRG